MTQHTLALPSVLNRKLQGMTLANESLVLSGEYKKATEGFKNIYEMLRDEQPPQGRYHKGHPLHQIGYTLVRSGNPQKALRYFILAYIEDLLSVQYGEEGKADDMPAARALRGGYTVHQDALTQLRAIVHEKKESGTVVHDPETVLDELAKGKPPEDVVQPTSTPSQKAEKRRAGKFQSDWEKRVFIGGDYASHFSEINGIKTLCQEMGYEPVIASDFETSPGMVHHHALMLLHECSRAIFEVSSNAGQLMEIERLRDYGYQPDKVLIVCQLHGHPSGMLEALLKTEGYQMHRYNTNSELIGQVRTFLS